MRIRHYLRRTLGVDDTEKRLDKAAQQAEDLLRTVHALSRQIQQLRGLLLHQSDATTEARRPAGSQSDEEPPGQSIKRVLRVVESSEDVIIGPWTGEVGFELLYWIPFVTWLVEQGLDPRRIVVVSRGGAAPWYRHLSSRYVDVLELTTPEQFRDRTAGPKKQLEKRNEFDRELVDLVKRRLSIPDASVVHPSVMYRLFSSLWRKRATINLVESFTSFRSLVNSESSSGPDDLPPGYVVAKFYYSKAFPETGGNRRFVADLLDRVSRQAPVALITTGLRLDEHEDFRGSTGSGVFVIDAHKAPEKNLDVQTRLICRSRGFIGTYGGFSYLAPFYGVRSLSFFSRRFGFESHHLDLAERVFDKMLPGGFVAIDRRAIDIVEPAIDRWTTAPPLAAPDDADAADALRPVESGARSL
jgi:hypothetical protein